MDHEEGVQFFSSDDSKLNDLKIRVIRYLNSSGNEIVPEELIEYEYRKTFGYTHKQFDEIPSKRYERDLVIMSLLNQHKNLSRS